MVFDYCRNFCVLVKQTSPPAEVRKEISAQQRPFSAMKPDVGSLFSTAVHQTWLEKR
jgi:hypothetical protein